MDSKTIEVASLAGNVTPVLFTFVDSAATNANVVADRNREAIHCVFVSFVGLFE